MRFLVDENPPPRLAKLLTTAEHDGVHVRDLEAARAPDSRVMTLAVTEDRVIVSADTDFGALLAYARATKPSVILVRELVGLHPVDLANIILGQVEILEPHLRTGAIAATACSSSPPAVVGKGENAGWPQPPGETMTGHGVVRLLGVPVGPNGPGREPPRKATAIPGLRSPRRARPRPRAHCPTRQVGVILLPGARLGLGVTGAGSIVAGAILVVPAIWVVIWRHVGVTGPVGSHRTSPPSRSAGRY